MTIHSLLADGITALTDEAVEVNVIERLRIELVARRLPTWPHGGAR